MSVVKFAEENVKPFSKFQPDGKIPYCLVKMLVIYHILSDSDEFFTRDLQMLQKID